MLKYTIYTLLLFLLPCTSISAQQDSRARTILDKVAATYNESQGMLFEFSGTQRGTLWVKGDAFVLECGGVKSWFDGKTQWTYVEQNEEVNVSNPTPEELQAVNPYALVTMYRTGFNYRYEGFKTRNGKENEEISLIPMNQQNIRMFILAIDKQSIPAYIGVDMTNGHYEEFILTNYKQVALDNAFFTFNEEAFPNAEIIDLR